MDLDILAVIANNRSPIVGIVEEGIRQRDVK
jgi:hypothetical protein